MLFQCETGADICAMITSLAALLLDPFYRSIYGFALLVERQWLHHASSIGWKASNNTELAAPFIVFIDCVWQLLSHFPQSINFNEDFLLLIINSLYSARFGTFLCSSEKQRIKYKVEKGPSIWAYVHRSVRLLVLIAPQVLSVRNFRV